MELKKEQYEEIKECFPKQRKPAKISNLEVLNAVLYVVENGCKWKRLPKEYGDWHVIYVRVNRWAKKGVLQEAFAHLQQLGMGGAVLDLVQLALVFLVDLPDNCGHGLACTAVLPGKKDAKTGADDQANQADNHNGEIGRAHV